MIYIQSISIANNNYKLNYKNVAKNCMNTIKCGYSNGVLYHVVLVLSIFILQLTHIGALPEVGKTFFEAANLDRHNDRNHIRSTHSIKPENLGSDTATQPISTANSTIKGYFSKLDMIEKSLAEVLIKVAYGTTSTTKRSIPDHNFISIATTIATPFLTTSRYQEKAVDRSLKNLNFHRRNYELDLERDHALPTSAPNADILKSNSNPTYPNPNRFNHNYSNRGQVSNSTPSSTLSDISKKINVHTSTSSTIFSGEMPSYSPPSRSHFTPPLPPEYQNPFADKPTLRGTNNEVGIVSHTSGSYINRRPIPPPSLMPGHERIPLRPPDFTPILSGSDISGIGSSSIANDNDDKISETDRKKVLNTPFYSDLKTSNGNYDRSNFTANKQEENSSQNNAKPLIEAQNNKQVLPSIRRILSGSNGSKGEIPEVLLKQVTSRPIVGLKQNTSPKVLLLGETSQQNKNVEGADTAAISPNINQRKNTSSESSAVDYLYNVDEKTQTPSNPKHSNKPNIDLDKNVDKIATFIKSSTPTLSVASTPSFIISTFNATDLINTNTNLPSYPSISVSSSNSISDNTYFTFTTAWNIHVYLSAILYTIVGVYLLYKLLIYNKLTHLFSQSYFLTIYIVLVVICGTRIFYLCYDAYNLHSSFNIFVSEILLNLPSTFLTVSFSVLILFLFIKSFHHKNHRYTSLIRPLTVVVGCGVHVVLCITLHYVESYTIQNHQYLHFQQQHQFQQQAINRRHHQQYISNSNLNSNTLPLYKSNSSIITSPPPRVLSLLCQIIYIFICLSLGFLYLYLYRILKRVLLSKSQNYIHGYHNLSYAIHITIATALLFILLAALQIFGAVSNPTTRYNISRLLTDIDWLHWGYQFSLRLIEIAIITLISWVAGLRTRNVHGGGGVGSGINSGINISECQIGSNVPNASTSFSLNNPNAREKQSYDHHTNFVSGFFLPCTSTSSQEQFDTDYPAICNANTNLHTYTMRTGKLIYDDSFVLSSLPGGGGGGGGSVQPPSSSTQINQNTDFQQHNPYQRSQQQQQQQQHNSLNQVKSFSPHNKTTPHDNQIADYITDASTDHYENPNFDLRFTTTSTASDNLPTELQMVASHSDSCYSEPMQKNYIRKYDFDNLEKKHEPHEIWSGPPEIPHPNGGGVGHRHNKKLVKQFITSNYEDPERSSLNSAQSEISESCHEFYMLNTNPNNGVNGSRGDFKTFNNVQQPKLLSNQSKCHTLAPPNDRIKKLKQKPQLQSNINSINEHDKRCKGGAALSFGNYTLNNKSKNERDSMPDHTQNCDGDIMTARNAVCNNLISDATFTLIDDATNIHIDRNFYEQTNVASAAAAVVAEQQQQQQQHQHHQQQQQQKSRHHHHQHYTQQKKSNSYIDCRSTSSNSGTPSTTSEDATSSSMMLVAQNGFVRFRVSDTNTDTTK